MTTNPPPHLPSPRMAAWEPLCVGLFSHTHTHTQYIVGSPLAPDPKVESPLSQVIERVLQSQGPHG